MNLSFRRIAIVNRGEPAMRLIHAVHELNEEHALGLRAIALYTEPDRRSLFVREASEAICLGSATFVDPKDNQRKSTYLDYTALERALVESRAEAAWVGWGFVAEHAEFADLCERLGIVFVGPPGAAIRRVGDKIASKRLAESAGVPVAPWSGGAVETVEQAVAVSERLGFPLMLKATAGGGGRGVRRIRAREDLASAIASAQAEALKFFGDKTVFLEKAISPARHVEVQVLADKHGACWAVGVRDCTLQRRNQKVLEEAPSPVLAPNVAEELCRCAERVTVAAGYSNAGTVEFLLDPHDHHFFFMEMNTRLQVEHPVTEATTGLDLVKMQLQIANGGALDGAAPKTVGHAVEVRLNAEDPDNNFAPAPGTIELFRLPTGPGLRVDTGVAEGDSIAPEFDSMVAKIIAYGKDRREAIARLRRALAESAIVVRGGTTNKAFLLELLAHPDVTSNRTDVGWLDRTWGSERPALRRDAAVALIDAALYVHEQELALEQKNFFVSASRGRPLVRRDVTLSVELRHAGANYKLDVRLIGPNEYRVSVDGMRIEVVVHPQGQFERWLSFGQVRHRVLSVVDGVHHLVEVDGVAHRLSRDDGGTVRAPAPAVVLAIRTEPGDTVEEGEVLVVLEAMKMETAVVAPCRGRVRKVLVRPNVQVVAGAALVLLEPDAAAASDAVVARADFASLAEAPKASAASPESTTVAETPDRDALQREARRLLLGYDIAAAESVGIRKAWAEARRACSVDDPRAWKDEVELATIFADLLGVYQDEPAGAFEQRPGSEETLHQYLRSVRLGGKGLAAGFATKLKRALAHYGVTSLDPTPALDQALLLAYKARHRIEAGAGHIFAVLERWVAHADVLAPRADAEIREVLDRLIAATQDGYLPVNDLARQARFCLFDRPRFDAAQEEGGRELQKAAMRLVELDEGRERAALMESIVASPHPLGGVFAAALTDGNRSLRRALVEAILRRFFRTHRFSTVRFEELGGHSVLSAAYEHGGATRHAVATHATLSELEGALAAAKSAVAALDARAPTTLDLYVSWTPAATATEGAPPQESSLTESDVLSDAFRKTLLERVNAATAEYARPLASLCVVLLGAGRGKPIRVFCFIPVSDGGYREHDVHPSMHPMMADRLEIWRLGNFKVEQLPAPEHTYLFHAIARENPKDERLFSFVDVRDVTVRRDSSGAVVDLPNFEHLFLEAVASIREVQARRGTRDRLQWNRIAIFLWSAARLAPTEIMRFAKRLAPAAKNLGVEKTVVRLRLPDPATGALVDRVIHVSSRGGTGVHMRFVEVSNEKVRPLTTYAQRVIQMRRLSLVYPYEIVRMLTPSPEREQTEFPPGEFVEYDLDEALKLVPCPRPAGENKANIVVGVIRNFTQKYPEGMTRVLLLGDPSREMGALAEPECRRIIAAFDLAERMGVPLDWFPVSSGAKIAMNVGTEALDWVARVLRRVIEFTQAGHTANVVVTGVNVGAQSYWDAEAAMLMHTKGILVMTPQGSMVLTGKRALDYSGGVSAETNQGIGGFERIMGPNGEAHYWARDVAEACHILFRHHEHAYVAPGERFPRRASTSDPTDRDICLEPHAAVNGTGFERVGDVFSLEKNPGRKKPFDVRSIMRAVVDKDHDPFERWLRMRDAETAVTWDAHLGGIPVALIGIESKPLARFGMVPADGPEAWTGGTLFPQSSKKVARAINAASGNRPVVVLANLSGFDGSPESLRKLQLEHGAEIGRAVVNFRGPLVFAVISRYHGGAYVVFSRTLNDTMHVVAVEGSHASVIGGAPAAAVVFPAEVKSRTIADPRVRALQAELTRASDRDKPRALARYDEAYRAVYTEKQGQVAEEFDRVHSVERARDVGSLHGIVPASTLRSYLIRAVEQGMASASSTS